MAALILGSLFDRTSISTTTEILQAQTLIPILIFLAIAATAAIIALIKTKIWRRQPEDKTGYTGILEAGGYSKLLRDNKPLDLKTSHSEIGIGTGVVKIFQQIKDNIGNLNTLTEGYRHLLNLSCEHLGFDAGAVFIIDHDGRMRLRGYAGIKPETDVQYTIEGTGIIADLFHSDFPRFETDPGKIPGDYHGLFDNYKAAWLLPLMPQGQPAGIILFLHSEIPDHRENFFPKLDFVNIAASWFYENHNNHILIAKENKRNKMLVGTSLAISSSLDLDEVCNILVKNLGRAYGCSYSYILLESNQDEEMYVQKYYSERGDPVFNPDERYINIAEMIWLKEIINHGIPVMLDLADVRIIPRPVRDVLKLEGSTNVLVAPLKHAGKFTGVLIMVEQRSSDRTSMDHEVVNLTAALVAQASSAIENARMYSMISHRVAHLKTMFDVGQALNSDLDLIPFIQRVLSTISKNFAINNCAFLMRESITDELYVASIVGEYPEETLGRRIKIGAEGITGHAAALGLPINVPDISKDERFLPSTGKTRSELAIPVILNGEVAGVLDVESESEYAFSDREVQFLKSLMDQVAAAMEKLKLKRKGRERASKLAITNVLVKRLSGVLNQTELLSEAVKGIYEGFGFDLVAVFVPNDDGSLSLAQQSCRTGYGYKPGLQLMEGQSLLTEVAVKRESLIIDYLPESEKTAGLGKVRSRYCLPLVAGQKFHGILDILDKRSRVFTDINRSTLQTISEFLAITLNNISLYVDTIDKAERLSLAGQISEAISATLDLKELFNRIVNAISEITGYNWATLIFKENGSYRTSSEYFHQSQGDLEKLLDIESMIKYFDEVTVFGKPIYYNLDKMALADSLRSYFSNKGINYIAISPIKRDDSPECFLLVGNPNLEGFRPQDQNLLNDVSRHLQIALNNAMLYSELKKAYNRIGEAQEKLIQSEKLKALGEVSAGIVHDFKNILAAIVGRTQMLTYATEKGKDTSPEMLNKSLEIIEKSATEGVNILSRINEFTKRKSETKFTQLDLKDIIEDTLEIIRPKWDDPKSGKNVSIDKNISDDLRFMGNRSMIVEVISNLVHNAVDAIENKGTIKLIARQIDNCISVRISDDGAGMDSHTVKRIFDPFFTTKERLGTGLGLTMVYSIIESHNGDVEVESVKGEGTTFTIRLPYITKPGKTEAYQILVVEDDLNLRNVLNEVLTELNVDVTLAGTYKEAKEILANKSFDMVLTDLGLPDKDGWTIIDSVRSLSPDCFIVPMTGWKKEVEKEELYSRGLTQILKKPFNIDQIHELIVKLDKRKTNAKSFV
ncbi:MAG: GAF domain-containing protein [candidate division Zixibacteria bacterium]|nr:GAF domain-containing protein [candidate division Zixibacteria bacterium]